MITLRLTALFMGTVLTLALIDSAFAESEKKTIILKGPTSVESKGKAITNEDKLKKMADSKFNRVDINKDGKITLQEYMIRYETDFKVMDKNKDGSITREEFEISLKRRMKRMHKKRNKK
jgi:Ca2+-binding EF-hand superfamily protein